MTLDEAIEHYKEKMNGCVDSSKEYEQLYYWLLELKLYREMAQTRYYKMAENIKDKSALDILSDSIKCDIDEKILSDFFKRNDKGE